MFKWRSCCSGICCLYGVCCNNLAEAFLEPMLLLLCPPLLLQLRTQVLTCNLGRDETVAQGLLALAHNKEVTDLVVGISGYR